MHYELENKFVHLTQVQDIFRTDLSIPGGAIAVQIEEESFRVRGTPTRLLAKGRSAARIGHTGTLVAVVVVW